jgi:hypothetical protein
MEHSKSLVRRIAFVPKILSERQSELFAQGLQEAGIRLFAGSLTNIIQQGDHYEEAAIFDI